MKSIHLHANQLSIFFICYFLWTFQVLIGTAEASKPTQICTLPYTVCQWLKTLQFPFHKKYLYIKFVKYDSFFKKHCFVLHELSEIFIFKLCTNTKWVVLRSWKFKHSPGKEWSCCRLLTGHRTRGGYTRKWGWWHGMRGWHHLRGRHSSSVVGHGGHGWRHRIIHRGGPVTSSRHWIL